MTLAEIFKAEGCDKHLHCYDQFYSTLTAPVRMLEVGVWKGASLRAWQKWWPNARVIGLDTFQRGQQPDPNDLHTVNADSRTWAAPRQWLGTFRLIVDDGSHKPRDQAATFRNLWPLLAPGGVYVIEDVLIVADDGLIPAWFAARSHDFNRTAFLELTAALREPKDAEPVTAYDYRDQSGKPDSVLFVVRKPA